MYTSVISCIHKEVAKMKTIEEVAKMFNVNPMTIRRWIDSGKLKAFQADKIIRISETEIENFIQENQKQKKN